ncbi:MAG: hypothetical protein WBA16_11780 [Nonlabens sp.]
MKHTLFYLPSYFVFQSTLYLLREIIVGYGFKISSSIYCYFKTGKPWNITISQLLTYPANSLGYHLGCFLLRESFELQPSCESHDIFHVITGYPTDTASEISMQYWLYGNGKRSPCTLLAMAIGLVLFMDQWSQFKASFKRGQVYSPITHLDYRHHLNLPLLSIKFLKQNNL